MAVRMEREMDRANVENTPEVSAVRLDFALAVAALRNLRAKFRRALREVQ
jgi:hypothetical protein